MQMESCGETLLLAIEIPPGPSQEQVDQGRVRICELDVRTFGPFGPIRNDTRDPFWIPAKPKRFDARLGSNLLDLILPLSMSSRTDLTADVRVRTFRHEA